MQTDFVTRVTPQSRAGGRFAAFLRVSPMSVQAAPDAEKLSPYQQNLACFRALASPAFGADEKEKIPVLSLIKSLHKSLHSLMRYFKKCVDLSVASGNPIGASPARRSGSRTALMPTSVEQPSGVDQLKKWRSHN